MRSPSSQSAARRAAFRPVPLAAIVVLAASLATRPAAAQDADIVPCYDAERQLVMHTLATLCRGEVIGNERERALAAERAARIQTTLDRATMADPVTGKRRLSGTGSGFYITAGGEILTNDHVANHCAVLTATPDDGSKLAAHLVATAPRPDIALLRTDQPPQQFARFSPSPDRSERHLAVVGYPAYGLSTRLSSLTPAEIEPTLLATGGVEVQFHGEIRRGNSGSPLLDAAGNVVGIVHATVDTPKIYHVTGRRVTDIGVAISYAAVMNFLAEHGVTPSFAEAAQQALPAEALHVKSRGFVVQIGCWN